MFKLSKFQVYVFLSIGLAAGVIYQTFSKEHVSFALAITRLTNSKLNNAILINVMFAILMVVVSFVIKFFFGEMREIERYDIINMTKQKILSFAFIMIVLHDDLISSHLIIIFAGVLAWYILHWLTIKRSEYLIMENQGNYKGHIKISILYIFLTTTNILLLKFFFDSLFRNADSTKSDRHVSALIGFEILILFLKLGSPLVKYFVNLIELLTLSHFERKSTLLSIVEFTFTVFALLSELWFFYFIYQTFQTPLHLILEAIESVMSLVKTTTKFYSSIVLVRKLSKLPDVTQEDIENIDSTCLICLHDITSSNGKKINCGHIFHLSCLKGWIQGNVNQFCPKCKQPIKIENTSGSTEADNAAVGGAAAQGPINIQNVTTKLEKLNDLNFGLENLMIMKLYNEILLSYIESNERAFEGSTHQDVIRRIYMDLLESQESGKDQIGALEYGLPRPAVAHRSVESENLRKKAKLVNYLILSQFGNHAFFKTNITGHTSIKLKPEPEVAPSTEEVEKPAKGSLGSILKKEDQKEKPKGGLGSILNKKAEPKEPVMQKAISLREEVPKAAEPVVNVETAAQDDEEKDALRRRQLFLAALERRVQTTDEPEESQENKKTQ